MLDWLPWQDAAEMGAASGAVWLITSSPRRRRRSSTAPRLYRWAKELTLVFVLYAMWQYAGRWSLGRASAALGRGRRIWATERWAHIPSERSVQQLVLGHRSLVRLLDVYYAEVHVPALGVLLVWLFIRHRDHYAPVRTVVALVTGASLLIQMLPVAPPRLVDHIGVIDTGALVGPNEYGGGAPGIDQLSAMPSLHVAWALIAGVAVVWVGRRWWRWLALGYPALTTFTVVATGNHYWADGVVAALLCVVAAGVASAAYGSRESLRTPEPDRQPLLA